jgi:hypothetical protein
MKVVVNRCYGGFSISPLAIKRMAEIEGKPCYFFTRGIHDKKYTPITVEEACNASVFSVSAFTTPNPNEDIPDQSNWHEMSLEERQESNRVYESYELDSRPDNRANPALVQVVEELGEDANGSCAELAVVEIPDDVEWEIKEYDGREWVAESHRTW